MEMHQASVNCCHTDLSLQSFLNKCCIVLFIFFVLFLLLLQLIRQYKDSVWLLWLCNDWWKGRANRKGQRMKQNRKCMRRASRENSQLFWEMRTDLGTFLLLHHKSTWLIVRFCSPSNFGGCSITNTTKHAQDVTEAERNSRNPENIRKYLNPNSFQRCPRKPPCLHVNPPLIKAQVVLLGETSCVFPNSVYIVDGPWTCPCHGSLRSFWIGLNQSLLQVIEVTLWWL